MDGNLDEKGFCKECEYYKFIHAIMSLPDRCKTCLKPIRERLKGHGIYEGKKNEVRR